MSAETEGSVHNVLSSATPSPGKTRLEDLDQRDLLGETLAVCLGEFGRTPTTNGKAGRDHRAACNSVVLAGGSVGGGQVLGASNRAPVSPGDLAATVYNALAIGPQTEVSDSLWRPPPLDDGRPLHELF